jgi:hydrogenase expression/formation protein HypC
VKEKAACDRLRRIEKIWQPRKRIMCLAVPMKLIEITGEGRGKVDSGGVSADVVLTMVPHAKIGDYLIIHAGFAIEVLDEEEAHIRLDIFRELAQATAQLEDY